MLQTRSQPRLGEPYPTALDAQVLVLICRPRRAHFGRTRPTGQLTLSFGFVRSPWCFPSTFPLVHKYVSPCAVVLSERNCAERLEQHLSCGSVPSCPPKPNALRDGNKISGYGVLCTEFLCPLGSLFGQLSVIHKDNRCGNTCSTHREMVPGLMKRGPFWCANSDVISFDTSNGFRARSNHSALRQTTATQQRLQFTRARIACTAERHSADMTLCARVVWLA